MNQLSPCPHCRRHVKVSETACPFCTRSLADAFANLAPRVAPRARLGRAATFAFGVLAMSPAACDPGTRPAQDAASIGADADVDAGIPDDADIGQDADYDGGGVPIYAAAPTRDADTTSRG